MGWLAVLAGSLTANAHSQDPWSLLGEANFEMGRFREAATAFQNALNQNPSQGESFLGLGLSLLRLNQPDEAEALLSAALRRDPQNRKAALGLALAQLKKAAFERALETVDRAVNHRESEAFLAIRAVAWAELGQKDRALSDLFSLSRKARLWSLKTLSQTEGHLLFFERAIERDPQDVRLLQAYVQRLLQMGKARRAEQLMRSKGLRPTETPHPEAQTPDAKAVRNEAQILRDFYQIALDERGQLLKRWRFEVQIDGPEAWARYRQLTADYWSQAPLRIVKAELLTPQGQTSQVRSQKIVVPPGAGDMRMLVLSFGERHQPPPWGTKLLLETETPIPFLEAHQLWDGVHFQNEGPTKEAQFELALPLDWDWSVDATGAELQVKSDQNTRSWSLSLQNLPPKDEARNPVAIYFSSFKDWAAVDAWYASFLQFKPQPQLQAYADFLCKNQSKAHCAASILRAVSQFQYVGNSIGRHAFQPRPPEVTLAQRQGDCKDLTALMQALLKSQGMESFAALADASGRSAQYFRHPSPGWFDHVLLYWPEGQAWLDATDRSARLSRPPRALRQKRAFVVDGKGGFWAQIPDSPLEEHRYELRAHVKAAKNGYVLTAEWTLSGDTAQALRERFLGLDASDLRYALAQPGRLLPLSVAPRKLLLRDFERLGDPLQINAEFLLGKSEVSQIDWKRIALDGLLRGDAGDALPFGRLLAEIELPFELDRRVSGERWEADGPDGARYLGAQKIERKKKKTRIQAELRQQP